MTTISLLTLSRLFVGTDSIYTCICMYQTHSTQIYIILCFFLQSFLYRISISFHEFIHPPPKKHPTHPFFCIHWNGGLGANEGFASEIFKSEFGHLHCCHGSLWPWTSLVSRWANKPHVLGGYQVRAASEWRMGQGMRVTVIWKICWKHPYHPWDERYIYLHENHKDKRSCI